MAEADFNIHQAFEGLMLDSEPISSIFKAIELLSSLPGTRATINELAHHGWGLSQILHNQIDVVREEIAITQTGRLTM